MVSNNIFPLPRRALLLRLGERAKALRLQMAWSRRELSVRAEVAEWTIKRFETTGEIGVNAMVSLLIALGCSDQVEAIFAPKAPVSLADLKFAPPRTRGRRSDVGKSRTKESNGE